jgi:hypothetical protein
LKEKIFFSGFVSWGSQGVLYPKMVEKFEKNSLVLGGLKVVGNEKGKGGREADKCLKMVSDHGDQCP